MPEHKVSWLLCIGRLVSKHRKVMHWRSSHWSRCWLLTQFHNWSTRSHKCRLTVRRWLVMCALFTEALHGASSNVGWHCWIVYCFWGRFTWSFFQEEHLSNAGPTRADQCSDGWHCQVLVGFCLGSMLTWRTSIGTDQTELIFWWWRGCALEGIEDAWVACGEEHMWSQRVSITFWGVCNHVTRSSVVLAS